MKGLLVSAVERVASVMAALIAARRVLVLTLLGLMVLGAQRATAATTWLVDDDHLDCPAAQFTSIQSAVSAAAPGDHINVCPGTYAEQVIIGAGKDNIRLRSIRRWQAVIKAPAVMVPDPFPNPAFTIVRVAGAQNVSILAFTITGPGPGGCGSLHFGVRVDSGGSADILGNHITDIRDAPPPPMVSGCQNGVAVQVGRQADATTGSARIMGNVIDNYQKNGPTVDNVGSHAEIVHNRILGVGPTATIAQNGIQASRGATAVVRHNFVADHIFTPQTFASTGLLLFQSGMVLTDHNTITSNDVGAFPIATAGSTLTHNRVRGSTFDGIALFLETGSQVVYNKVDQNSGPGIGVYDSDDSTLGNNLVENNGDSGVLLDDANGNFVGHNQVRNNGTADGDTTDGIRVTMLSMGNTLQNNHLKNNVTHDCHDDSTGGGTSGTANTWANNHGETSNPPGLCSGGADDLSFETPTAFGWDENYPWYAGFEVAAEYDWATAYATIDTDSLLQLLPEIGSGGVRGVVLSPAP